MKIKKDCCGCFSCYSICPQGAIIKKIDYYGFEQPIIDKEKCIKCGLCEKVCPLLTPRKENVFEKKSYVAFNENDDDRINSSSGGIFILLAKSVIKKGGIVFGAYLNENNNVEHGYVTENKELRKFMGSKYVQSKIGDNYKKVKEFLEKGKSVLFTGTPCQIEGLKNFLGKEYDNLYTQDIICHGVPSPLVWEKYKLYRNKKDRAIPKKINFRNKDNGWKNYNIEFEYNDFSYKQNKNEDLFMKAFLKDTCLRASCYSCAFKNENKISDITLGDYWGIQNIHPEMDDDKGVSAVIINSGKGKKMFEEIKEFIEYKETDYESIKKYNPSLVKSTKCDKNREKFFKNLDKLPFDELVEKYTYKPSFFKKIINKIKYEVSKLIKKK